MSKRIVEIFENEEAEKFLEYFVAFRKFSSKANDFRRLIAASSEIALSESQNLLGKREQLDAGNQNQSAIGLATAQEEAESISPRS